MSVTFVNRNFIVALIDAYSSSIIKRQGLNSILITRSDSFISMIIRLSVSESTVAKTSWSLVSTMEEFTAILLMLIPMRSHKLTHLCRVTHICVSKSTIIVSDNGLSPDRRPPSHYLNQCWNIVNWNLRNNLQWNINQNSYIFIQENAFENVVRKLAAILSLSQCVRYAQMCQVAPESWRHLTRMLTKINQNHQWHPSNSRSLVMIWVIMV